LLYVSRDESKTDDVMNRAYHFNYIEEKLSVLVTRIELRGKLNILDLHLHSENFYLHFMNKLFGWQLVNMNVTKHNVEAIDLIDKKGKIVVQVSSTATKQKIESALTKKNISAYSGYAFKFVSISKDASELKKQSYKNPHNLCFTPQSDIYDIKSILSIINTLEIENQQNIFSFIKQELGKDTDITKVETNLAKIIKILASEEWDSPTANFKTESFDIERKIKHNDLDSACVIIEDFAANTNRVDKIYEEFDKLGVNKSSSVLASIRNMYVRSKDSISADDLFFDVIDQVLQRIQSSSNYSPIPFDELEMCVNILVVDAFIRCKIFEDPEGYEYAAAR